MSQAYNGHRIDEAYKHSQAYLKLILEKGAEIDPNYKEMISTIKQEIEDVWEYERELGP
jgi:hypothetical protein